MYLPNLSAVEHVRGYDLAIAKLSTHNEATKIEEDCKCF